MRHLRLIRGVLGSAGLAACIGLLAGQARAQGVGGIYERWNTDVVTGRSAPVTPDLFGTVALPVRADRYAAGWRRAARDASFLPSMQRLVAPARGLAPGRRWLTSKPPGTATTP